MVEKFTIGIIVSNHFGVLNRVAGLYAKRGYNIDSLAVGETQDSMFSRMTIVSTGDKYMKEQVVRQLAKLYDVKMAVVLDRKNSVSVEHMLIKIKTNGDKATISRIINDYSGKVMDFSDNFITAEITGSSEKIEEFIGKVTPYKILEVCRSGPISMAHGMEDILGLGVTED
ncbi:MAG: acetolactate synthase small subunit [Oscillospiraceae bacterium]|jgi:acetolactate synthase-1/3 small subunit|nr:acetolactate synthase small subunit [Oscillospiraceae bacterium]